MCKIFIVVTEISKNVPATSVYFQWFSKDFWTLPQMSKDVPTAFKHFWSYLKTTIFACSDTFRTQSQYTFMALFWEHFQEIGIEFLSLHCTFSLKKSSRFVWQEWQIMPLTDEIIVVSPQEWDTHNGRFQKISIPYHGRLLGFPKGRGGSRLWNSEGMGGIYDWKSEGMGEFHRWDFWSRKCRVSLLVCK